MLRLASCLKWFWQWWCIVWKGAEQNTDLEQRQGHSRSDAQGREHVCANDDIWPSADVEQFRWHREESHRWVGGETRPFSWCCHLSAIFVSLRIVRGFVGTGRGDFWYSVRVKVSCETFTYMLILLPLIHCFVHLDTPPFSSCPLPVSPHHSPPVPQHSNGKLISRQAVFGCFTS